jgi:hypothetical protein
MAIVQPESAARDAKARYSEWRHRLETRENSRMVLEKHGSRKKMRRASSRKTPEIRQPDLFR